MSDMRLVLLALATGLGVVGTPSPASAAPGERTISSPVVADGWYVVTTNCAEGVGCAPVPSLTSYPSGTLHVGTSMSGSEEARTYLKLDLDGLPAGARLSGGALALPVAPAEDGSAAVETAKLRVCVATAAFDSAAEGSPNPPAIDCSTSAPAAFEAGANRFTADLSALAGLLTKDTTHGLAVVPAADSTGQWRVAMSSSARQGGTTSAPSAQLTFRLSTAPAPSSGDRPAEPAPEAPTDDRPAGPGRTEALPPPYATVVPPQAAAPATTPAAPAAPPAVATPAQVFTGESPAAPFAYPAVFLVPIALLAGAGWSARAFTRDLLPASG